tara:strand:- start:8433 stop:8618 length:186 start_codon:yes stop_codon:yes gene_type:complete
VKVGDLVKMKYEMWWKLRSRKYFVSDIGTVVNKPSYNIIEVLLPDGSLKNGLVENWEVINV